MEDEMKRKKAKPGDVDDTEAKDKEPQKEPEKANEEQAPESKDAPGEEQKDAKKEDQAVDLKPLLEASRQKAEEYLNLAQRVQADFDNYRRRNQSIRAEAYEDGAKDFIKTLLPVVDNLERALQAESHDDAMHSGVEMVLKQLMDVLQKRGVTVIDRLNEKFDPNLENAVMQGTEEDGEKGTVCAVLQKGYKLGDYVLRHAMVKVVAED